MSCSVHSTLSGLADEHKSFNHWINLHIVWWQTWAFYVQCQTHTLSQASHTLYQAGRGQISWRCLLWNSACPSCTMPDIRLSWLCKVQKLMVIGEMKLGLGEQQGPGCDVYRRLSLWQNSLGLVNHLCITLRQEEAKLNTVLTRKWDSGVQKVGL